MWGVEYGASITNLYLWNILGLILTEITIRIARTLMNSQISYPGGFREELTF